MNNNNGSGSNGGGANGDDAAMGGTPTQPTASEGAASVATGTAGGEESAEPSSLEKGLDFTIGAALLTADVIEGLVSRLVEKGKVARESAPVVFDTLIERGRPTREQWLRTLHEEILPQFKVGRPDVPAEAEIQVLEERVATLEQQVGADVTSTEGAADTNQAAATPADAVIAHEATVLTEGGPSVAPVADAPPPDISEAATTDTPAEPEVEPTGTPEVAQLTEDSDAAVTGADTATDVEVSESASEEEGGEGDSPRWTREPENQEDGGA